MADQDPSSSELVLADQRRRILEAVGNVVAERGLRGASVAEVTKRAGLTRAAFRNHFDNLEGSYLALIDWMIEQVKLLISRAFQQEGSWHDGVIAGLEALLMFFDSEPICARACLLEGMTGAMPRLDSRTELLNEVGEFVDRQIRAALPDARHLPPVAAEATVTSVLGLLRRRILSGDVPPYVGLLGELAVVVVMPYSEAATVEGVYRKSADRAERLLSGDPAVSLPAYVEVPPMLRHASAHRMRACLCYLGDNPGASNQQIATACGIAHAGQVSALLNRLHAAGMLDKQGKGAGHPNAWWLSEYGLDVMRSLLRERAGGESE